MHFDLLVMIKKIKFFENKIILRDIAKGERFKIIKSTLKIDLLFKIQAQPIMK